MEIKTTVEDKRYIVRLSGDLNILTAPKLAACLEGMPENLNILTLDFTDCDYVSHSGLRLLMKTRKALKDRQGSMDLVNVGPNFLNVLKITGMIDLFDPETR